MYIGQLGGALTNNFEVHSAFNKDPVSVVPFRAAGPHVSAPAMACVSMAIFCSNPPIVVVVPVIIVVRSRYVASLAEPTCKADSPGMKNYDPGAARRI